MTLPKFVRNFWYASMELGQRTIRTPWGAVVADHRYPLVWDANNATVLEPAPSLTAQTLHADVVPSLRAAGAPSEHVEFWETSPSPALDEFRRGGQLPNRDVVMAFQSDRRPSLASDVQIEEVTIPDSSFWGWYRDSLLEFGTAHSEEVLDQMVARSRDVFLPAGLRFFVGRQDGRRAGYTSLLSLEDVGYLDNVVTMPAFRRRGVASATVSAAVEASLAGGDRHVFLLAEPDGAPQRLYERLGFRVRANIESFTRALPLA